MRYRIEIDYESPDEWSIGTPAGIVGEPATTNEIASVLELVARLYRKEFPNEEGAAVRHRTRAKE